MKSYVIGSALFKVIVNFCNIYTLHAVTRLVDVYKREAFSGK